MPVRVKCHRPLVRRHSPARTEDRFALTRCFVDLTPIVELEALSIAAFGSRGCGRRSTDLSDVLPIDPIDLALFRRAVFVQHQ